MLEALVDQATGDAAEHVADGCTEEQPDDRCVGAAVDVAADLESGQRAGQHEEEAEALDEDHGSPSPLAKFEYGIDFI